MLVRHGWAIPERTAAMITTLTLVRQDAPVAEPLDDGALNGIVKNAVRLAGVPKSARDDVAQSLALEVITRHGTNPPRARVSRSWLCIRARGHWIDELRARERATGQFAAALELGDDADPVYAAATVAGNVQESEPMTPARIAAALPSLTDRQRASVRLWLSERDEPLSNLDRQHFHAAMRKLRALSRDEIYAAMGFGDE